eukprot:gene23207-biopygen69798
MTESNSTVKGIQILPPPNLTLGAWGCGVFGNDPPMVAEAFRRHLAARSRGFRRVVFAVLDPTMARVFAATLTGGPPPPPQRPGAPAACERRAGPRRR